MKINLSKLFYILIAAILVIGIYLWRPEKDPYAVFKKPITASDLIESQQDGGLSNSFIDKGLEVSGTLLEINQENNKYALLIEGKNGSDILCELKEDQVSLLSTLKLNQHISIRGIYKGYLKDAILLNCELIDIAVHE